MQALIEAREIQDEYDRASVLSSLAPHLSAELETQVLEEALGAAREIKDQHWRQKALTALRSQVESTSKLDNDKIDELTRTLLELLQNKK